LIVLRVAGGEGGGYTGDLTGGFPENRENNRNIKGKGGVMTPPSRKLTR
jgi:hypothetical protein